MSGGPAGPEDDEYGPPDWFAAVAEEPGPSWEPEAQPEPRPRSSAARPRARSQSRAGRRERTSAPREPVPAPEREQSAEASVEALGLVSASELPTGRRRRRSALAAEEFATADDSATTSGGQGWAEAAGHGGVAASAPRRSRRGGRRAGEGVTDGDASGGDASGEDASGEDVSGEPGGSARTSRRRAEEQADPETRARDICLRLLTGAAKTRRQLADALRRREIPEDVADEVLTRLEEVGLIDDAAFAAAWVESRHAVRGLSRRALAQELRTKGVAADLVERAVAQLDHDDEEEAARALVERKLRSTRGLDQQVRTRRLVGVLARRGYSEGLAFRVVRSALEEEAAGGPSGTAWE